MAGKIVSLSEPRLHLDILRPEDIRQIHEATLEVIETVGVRFPSPQALDLWAEHGASVDRERMVVRAPAALIVKALQSAPPSYTLAARDPAQDLPLDGHHAYVGTDGCGVEVLDLGSGQRRRSTLHDVAEIARLVDAVPEVAFFWVPVSAQDRPAEARGLHELAAAWSNTTKHVQTETIYSAREARAAVEMAAAVAGGRDALRQRPLLSMMQCTIAPLSQDGGSVEAALIAAEAGLPVGFMTMASCTSTGPATMAGTLVVGNAEVLSALALILLTYPSIPVFYAAAQTAMDLRTGGYTGGGPEDFLFGAATNVLADFYNIPLSMGSFATGAKEPNWQAGLENSLSTLMACLTMADMLLGVGLLHGSRIWSHEQMLLDCEIWSIVRQVMRGIVVDEETLALEAIRAVGPGGHYLTQRHTRRHMGDLWVPTLLDRRPYEEWERDRAGPRDWARERARQLLATHQPEPLDPGLVAELDQIIARA
jgi:trimethylamine--corrinoid protein Co-methyltransferase